MKKYHSVEISETALEDLVRQAPELIEPGLKFVAHQAFTPRGPLDVLFVDSGKALVVAELKVIEDDDMLVQALDYYDYVTRNTAGFAHAYGQLTIDPEQQPRLFLIAPSFSVPLLNRIKWVDIPISLFAVQCIQFDDEKEQIPIYREITPPAQSPVRKVPTLDAIYGYITDSAMRSLAQKVVDEIKSWDSHIAVEQTMADVSIKYSGRVLAYVSPRRRHFVVQTYDAEGKWTGYPVMSETDIETARPVVRAWLDRMAASRV